ncbi:hypothetical protein AMS68_005043 [Peltaster fructicola]|uniref:ABC transporter domain-containing protein n=1 Tax=Peltaster fructicola TaxID=286661 RepID=A0A6H0XXX1_9PEZI|nr:hypothetical protein AMS68_005043 [Peltaster fructicola]
MQQYKWMWLKPFPTRLAQAAFSFAQPYLIYQLLYWLFIPTADSRSIGYGLLAGFACSYIGVSLTTSFGQYQVVRLCAKLRGDLILRIYTKSLEIKTCEIQSMAALTLMSTNVDKFVAGMIVLQEFIVSIPVVGIGLWLLERQVGLGAIGPVVTVAAAAVVIGACVPGIDKAQKAWLDAVKRRVQFATQVLAGYQTAKMSGLMRHLSSELQRLRAVELDISLGLRRYMVMTVATSLGMPNVSPLMALAVYAVVLRNNGETLNIVNAFTALAFLTLITFPLMVILQTAPIIIQGYSSLTQVGEYLRTGAPSKQQQLPLVSATGDVELGDTVDLTKLAVVLRGCTFTRSIELEPVHKNFSFDIPLRSFTLILGPSASGKSTLLEAMLGEIIRTSGTVYFNPDCQTKAYVAQRPWIRDVSIRDNIILTSPYDDAWYREVLHACALDEDVARINRADAGAGGAALSGGQKQKVSLARAIYSRRPLIVIDEPFTGVDGTSCDQITKRLFGSTGLIRRLGSTLVLASHSGRLLSQADHVLVLDTERRIAQQGNPRDLDLREYRHKRHDTPKDARETVDAEVINPTAYVLLTKREIEEHKTKDRRGGELAAYYYYFITLGPSKLVVVGLFVAIFTFFQLFTQPWVTWWTTSNQEAPNSIFGYWLGLYGLYAVLAILALAAACWLMLVQMIKASGNSLHTTLCKTLERAPITLFSMLSPGLTIDRFSQDMSLVDMELPLSLSSLAITGMVTLGQFGLVLSASKYIAAALPLTVAACVVIQRLYIKTSRQLRFHEIETKAPLYTQFIETLDGLATIRAYDLQTTMQDEMNIFVDKCQKAWYLLFCAQRYLGVTLNLTVSGLVIVLVGVAIAARGHTDTSFYGSSLVNTMVFGIEHSLETTEVVDHDAEMPFEFGSIRIDKLSTGYQHGSNVIHQISCDIPPGQKVAICGRSGSGKTTLLFSLLRLLEAKEGRIEIDARDVSHIPHEDLRKNISCVPQHPLILDATIRSNVDVLDEHSDEEVLAALKKAGLEDAFAEQGLDTVVTAKTLSYSQNQLVCLARALVKQRKVLVLDEATSSLDAKVDAKLQQVVCETLPGVTVISVMHRSSKTIRLNDCWRILPQPLHSCIRLSRGRARCT